MLAAVRLQSVCGAQFSICDSLLYAVLQGEAIFYDYVHVSSCSSLSLSLSSPSLLPSLNTVTTAASSLPPPPPPVGGSCYESDSSRGTEIRLCTLRSYCFSMLRRKSDGTVVYKRGCSNTCEEESRNRKVSSQVILCP